MPKHKLPVPTEDDECRTFLAWCRLVTYRGEPLIDRVVRIPNDRDRKSVKTAILVALGMRPGFPDYQVLVPTPVCPGLFLEAKRIRGRVDKDQEVWRDRLRAWGYEAFICEGGLQMIAATRAYMRAHARPGDFVDRTSGHDAFAQELSH